MPIYEYECQGCAHGFETIQKISEAPLTRCPTCGKDLLRKKISAVAFRLKGGGWYETDFKSGDKRNVASHDDGGESAPAAATSGAKADSKNGAAAAAKSSDGAAASDKKGTAKEAAKDSTKSTASSKDGAAKPAASSPSKGTSKGDS